MCTCGHGSGSSSRRPAQIAGLRVGPDQLGLRPTAGTFGSCAGPAPVRSALYLYFFGSEGSDASSCREVTCSELPRKPQPKSEVPASRLLGRDLESRSLAGIIYPTKHSLNTYCVCQAPAQMRTRQSPSPSRLSGTGTVFHPWPQTRLFPPLACAAAFVGVTFLGVSL